MNNRELLLKTADRIGLSEPVIRLYDQFGGFSYRDTTIDGSVRNFEPDEWKGTVLVPITRGQMGPFTYKYLIFAHLLRSKGYEPLVPLCNDDMSLCRRKSIDFEDRSLCKVCNYFGSTLMSEFGIDPVPLSTLVSDPPAKPEIYDPLDFSYRGVGLSKPAIACTRRYLKRYTLDMENQLHRSTLKRFIHSGMVLTDAFIPVFEEQDVDLVIAPDSTYNIGHIVAEIANRNDVPCYFPLLGKVDKTMMYGQSTNRSNHPIFTDTEVLADRVEEPLSKKEAEEIEDIMQDRFSGTQISVPDVINGTDGTDQEDVATDSAMFGLFTNLMWDASFAGVTGNELYTNYTDWLYDTIEEFRETNSQLIIKTHPAESTIGTNEPIEEIIRRDYGSLSNNIEIIPPDANINPYTLLDNIDVCLVYNSTVGLEAAYKGKPVVVVGDAHYRGLDFTYEPESIKEYREAIRQPDSIGPNGEIEQRAKRYCYFFFVQKHIPFPLISYNKELPSKITHSDIARDEDLSFVADQMLAQKSIFQV